MYFLLYSDNAHYFWLLFQIYEEGKKKNHFFKSNETQGFYTLIVSLWSSLALPPSLWLLPSPGPSTSLVSLIFTYFVLQKMTISSSCSISQCPFTWLNVSSFPLLFQRVGSSWPPVSGSHQEFNLHFSPQPSLQFVSPATCTRCILNIAPQSDPSVWIPLISQGDKHFSILLKMAIWCIVRNSQEVHGRLLSCKPQSSKSCSILLTTVLPFF